MKKLSSIQSRTSDFGKQRALFMNDQVIKKSFFGSRNTLQIYNALKYAPKNAHERMTSAHARQQIFSKKYMPFSLFDCIYGSKTQKTPRLLHMYGFSFRNVICTIIKIAQTLIFTI